MREGGEKRILDRLCLSLPIECERGREREERREERILGKEGVLVYICRFCHRQSHFLMTTSPFFQSQFSPLFFPTLLLTYTNSGEAVTADTAPISAPLRMRKLRKSLSRATR